MHKRILACCLVLAAFASLAIANDTVTLTITATGDGTVNPPPGVYTFQKGDTIVIQVTSFTEGVLYSFLIGGGVKVSLAGGSGTVTITDLAHDSWVHFDFGTLPEPEPLLPDMHIHYIRDEEGIIVGGRIVNEGQAPFSGVVSYRAGLAYNRRWQADFYTVFAKGELFRIDLSPREEVQFSVEPNEEGGYTFSFGNGALLLSVVPPDPDSDVVKAFRHALYEWFVEYVDHEPERDYIHVRVQVSSEGAVADGEDTTEGFWLPIEPYFERPEGR